MTAPKIKLPIYSGRKTPIDTSKKAFECETRSPLNQMPINITINLPTYFPLDRNYSYTAQGSSFIGMQTEKIRLESGKLYKSVNGKRLVFEVGCKSVIYLLISPGNNAHHNFFIQGRDGFLFDITTRVVAADVAQKTRHVETIVKYEMYFLMGLFSTVSAPAWLVVTASNATYTVAVNKAKVSAANNVVQALIAESDTIKKFAPTFHEKLWEFFESEVDGNWNRYLKQLPPTVAKDEQVQGQLAGILFGKATVSPKSLTFWGAILAVLTQATIKSVTKSGDAYMKVVNQRYGSLINALKSNNWRNPSQSQAAAQKLIGLYKESGVKITLQEGQLIIKEIMSNATQIEQSLRRIVGAINEYNKVCGN